MLRSGGTRGAFLLASALALAAAATLAVAQSPETLPQPSQGTPSLPETVVEGNPAPSEGGTATASDFGNTQPNVPTDPAVSGWMFGSPRAEGYSAQSATTGTLLNLPMSDIPMTVNVITEDVIQDQQILNFTEIARDAGAVVRGGDAQFVDRIFLRGLELNSRDYRKDGFLDPTFVPRDFQNVERVEILKGPASSLYGSGSPAGIVNLITKKPLDDRFVNFDFTFGSFEQQRYTLDLNTENSDGTVLFRLNLAQEESDNFVDFDFVSRALVAPSITWKLDDCTRLTWLGEYHRDHRLGYQGIPEINGDALALPPHTYAGQPNNDFIHYEEFRQTLLLTHELNDCWTFEIGGSSLFYQLPGSLTAASGNPAPGFIPDLPPPLFYQARTDILHDDEQSQSMIANLGGEFCTWGLQNKAVVGVEYVYFSSDSAFNFGALALPIDVSNPVYLNPPSITLLSADFPAFRQQRVGEYLQDLITVTPKWKLLAGVRFDTLDFHFDRTLQQGALVPPPPPPVTVDTDEQFNRTSPRVGLLYQPWEDDLVTFYANYSQSFEPPPGGVYLNPGNLQPITGEAYEVGVKTRLLKNLTFDACGFHAVRENDDFNASSIFLVQVGESRSQGAELNLLGQITDYWSVLGNYTYADSRIFDSLDPTFNDKRTRNVPFNTFNLWTRYNLIQEPCRTFGVAMGVIYEGSRPGDLTNTFDLPAFSRWDGGVYWRRNRLHAEVYLENIFDKDYAAASVNAFQVFPGAPFNARANVGITF